MPTKKEDKKELRYSEWAEHIAKCQSSGMEIKKRWHSKFQECNHYHKTHTTKRLKIPLFLLNQINGKYTKLNNATKHEALAVAFLRGWLHF